MEMSNSEEHADAKARAETPKRASSKKRTTTTTKSAAANPNEPQSDASTGTASGRVAISAAQRRLEEMGMIDSGEQKSSASVPSAWGFRIMVLIALVLFVVAVFFIRANSYRATATSVPTEGPPENAAQIEEQPQDAMSVAEADAASGQAPADTPSTDQQMTPPPGKMDGGGGMGYPAPGMQPPPPPMTGAMPMPLEVAPANPGAMQPHATGPVFQNGQPMQPMMGYGYGPAGPYYWFIVPIPQIPANAQPAYPGGMAPNGWAVPPEPAYDSSGELEQPDLEEQWEGDPQID
jgi:hypothetical protein